MSTLPTPRSRRATSTGTTTTTTTTSGIAGIGGTAGTTAGCTAGTTAGTTASTTAGTTASQPTRRRRRTPEERRADEDARLARAELRAQRRLVDDLASSPHIGIVMPSTPGPSEPSTLELGATAETVAVLLLEARGYHIVERNFRCTLGEIDIVAIDGDVMVFVEVRSRASADHGDAVDTINARKRRKVTQAAEVYLLQKQPSFLDYRFDVVAINGDDDIALYQDAWRGGLL